ncbi:MAG: ABC transporter permease subunit [bacterium]|nr:ABC transporter permease subunit [bacterium]
MRQWKAFIKKEVRELLRSGRLMLLLLLFCLFGVMNAAIAKLTPWMMEMMSEQIAGNGMSVSIIGVDALTAWTQFYKNMPVMLIVMIVMFGGTIVGELQKGTLIPIVAKGMRRGKILGAKALVTAVLWTGGYAISFAVTYAYSAYFWDNGIAAHLFFAAFCFWMLGMWLLSIIFAASGFAESAAAVMLTVGAGFVLSYVLTLIPAVKSYSPMALSASMALLTGEKAPADQAAALCVAAGLCVVNLAAGVWSFGRRRM